LVSLNVPAKAGPERRDQTLDSMTSHAVMHAPLSATAGEVLHGRKPAKLYKLPTAASVATLTYWYG